MLVQDMKQYAAYEEYEETSTIIRWFWEILEEFTEEDKANFLFFTTGILII